MISMLPFAAEEVMLPGEKRVLLLTKMSQIRMLERACNEDLGCFGQLLLHRDRSTENYGDRDLLACRHEPLVTLLQIMEIRNPNDPGGVEGAVWTEVKCAGVARLDTEPAHFSTPSSKPGQKFLCAKATSLPDVQAIGRLETLKLKVVAVNAAQKACAAKEAELMLRGPRLRSLPSADDGRGSRAEARNGAAASWAPSYGDQSHHVRAPLNTSLTALVKARREALLQNGLDEAPANSLRDLQPVWGMDCPLDAEAMLASWSAFAWLDGATRLEALRSRSWVERLSLAKEGLRRRERELMTEISLERALNGGLQSE